jgi:hypothetical protein
MTYIIHFFFTFIQNITSYFSQDIVFNWDFFFVFLFFFFVYLFFFMYLTMFGFIFFYILIFRYIFFVFWFFPDIFFTWFFMLLLFFYLFFFFFKLVIFYTRLRSWFFRKYIFPFMLKYIFPFMHKFVFPLLKFFFYYIFLVFFSFFLSCLFMYLFFYMIFLFFIIWWIFLFFLDTYILQWTWLKTPQNSHIICTWFFIMLDSLFTFSFFYLCIWGLYFKKIRKVINFIYKKIKNTFIFFTFWYIEKFWVFFIILFFFNLNAIFIYVDILKYPFWEINFKIVILNLIIINIFNFFCLLIFFWYLITCSFNLQTVITEYDLHDLFFFKFVSLEEVEKTAHISQHMWLLSFLLELFVFIANVFGYDKSDAVWLWYFNNKSFFVCYSSWSYCLFFNFFAVFFIFTYWG